MGPKNPKSVVITGASTGIGQACALHLDRLGFRVFAGVRREADGDSLRRQASDRLTPLILDVTDEATVGAAAEHVNQAVGNDGVYGLVNNAGIAIGGPLELIQLDDLRRQEVLCWDKSQLPTGAVAVGSTGWGAVARDRPRDTGAAAGERTG